MASKYQRRRLRTLRVADDDPPELLAFLGSFLTLTRERDEVRVDLAFFLTGAATSATAPVESARSEERRVGKEC